MAELVQPDGPAVDATPGPCGRRRTRVGTRAILLTRTCQQPKADGSACAAARRPGGLRRRREKVVSGAYDLSGVRDVDSIRRLLDVVVMDTLGLEDPIARSRTLITAAMAATRLLEVEASGAPPIVIGAGERAAGDCDGG